MHRRPAASRLTSWLFVAALLVKSAVPMLASAAAELQGRATAEVCDVYGVDTSMLAARSRATAPTRSHEAHPPHHAHDAEPAHHAHQSHPASEVHDATEAHRADGARSSTPAEQAPTHGPASRVTHGGDHCALSALAFALASDAPSVPLRPATLVPMAARDAAAAPLTDPAARWAAQLQHAPPASS